MSYAHIDWCPGRVACTSDKRVYAIDTAGASGLPTRSVRIV